MYKLMDFGSDRGTAIGECWSIDNQIGVALFATDRYSIITLTLMEPSLDLHIDINNAVHTRTSMSPSSSLRIAQNKGKAEGARGRKKTNTCQIYLVMHPAPKKR